MGSVKHVLLGIVGLGLIGGGLLLREDPAATAPPSREVEPCNRPLTYRVSDIDPRYDVSKAELKRVMRTVGALWAEAAGQKLIEYRPDGDLALHLIYSDEQQAAADEKAMGNRIEAKKSEYEVLDRRQRRLSRTYQRRREQYDALLTEYNASVDAFNATVSKWAAREKVPEERRRALRRRKEELSRLKRQLDRRREAVEALRHKVSAISSELSTLADELNALIARYNRRYSQPREYDQGKYVKRGDKEQIEVYAFSNLDDLTVVLTHEVGHALGLGHGSDPASVMYYKRDKQRPFDLSLSDEDVQAIQALCGH